MPTDTPPFVPGFWPTLEPPLEGDFRRASQSAEHQTLTVLAVVVMVAAAIFSPADFRLQEGADLWLILGCRAAIIAWSVIILAAMRSGRDHGTMDHLTAVWLALFVIADLTALLVRPPDFPGSLILSPVAVLAMYVLLPTRPHVLASLAAIESIGAVTGVFLLKDFSGPTVASHAITIGIANVLGMTARRRMARNDRARYLAHRGLTRSNAELEKAIGEIQTLRGIVPICSSCKKIRDDTGFWEAVEIYVERHSRAEFSHGLCPTCLSDVLAEHRSAKRESAHPDEDAQEEAG